ncbi:MAG TPA: cytochrome P460 family protein [Rhizomicrobium sp.]|jgi:hypothetical protein|nr:cytochrome P460 family protein [Rhizomicrobium sp.]
MTSRSIFTVAIAAVLAATLLGAAAEVGAPAGTPQYDADGHLVFPADYREWVFLSSGLDMSYSATPAMPGAHMFNNVFAPRAAYRAFLKTGVWPDKTMLMLEGRSGGSNVSIARQGVVQTGEIMGLEVHVKDTARFKGGWAFFAFDGDKPAEQIAYTASCYSCHQAHAAADTTFVQFYPTLLPAATALGTLNPAYVRETKQGK